MSSLNIPSFHYVISNNGSSDQRDRTWAAVCSVVLHVFFLLLGTLLLVEPVQFAVEEGTPGMDVELIAGGPEEIVSPPQPIEEPPVVVEEKIIAEPVVEKVEAVQETIPLAEAVQPVQVQRIAPKPVFEKPVPNLKKGSEAFSVRQGAITKVRPSYLRNPAPAYPYQARRAGQEGRVLLSVQVDRFGHPEHLMIKESSGFKLLDQSALKAVKRWKFNPAKVGGLAVEDTVEVPVRFQLNKNKS